MGSIEASISAG